MSTIGLIPAEKLADTLATFVTTINYIQNLPRTTDARTIESLIVRAKEKLVFDLRKIEL